jgi:phage terminase small subunit
MAAKAKKKPAKKAVPAKKRPQHSPTPRKPKQAKRIDLFVAEYTKDLNGRQAAIRAGYSPASARFQACELLAREDVQAKVQAALEARAKRVGIEADDVLGRLRDVAFADPRDLIQLRRGCCRYCYGKDHRYQRTPRELETARRDYEASLAELGLSPTDYAARAEEFDTEGGIGWDPRKDPHPECPECFGEGELSTFIKDSRDLTPQAALLYAGAKETQNGLEIKMHDQQGALVKLGEHLGLFKRKVELTGKDGEPVRASISGILEELGGAGADTGTGASQA